MADFAVPNLFRDSGGANVPAAIESGFGMGIRKQGLDMQKQAFANEQADREEMRNAMAQYGEAQDEESRGAALAKVGVVNPEARAKLEMAYTNASQEERAKMKQINNDAGSAAWMALQEQDPAKRKAIWDSYRNRLPENARRAVPDSADDLSLKSVLAQSSAAMDTMMDISKTKAEGEKQKDVAEYQGGINMGLKDRSHTNAMSEIERKAELQKDIENQKSFNKTHEANVKQGMKGGSNSIPPAVAQKMAESRDPEIRAVGREALGIGQQQQAPAVRYKYVAGKGVVPITE